MHFSWLSPQSVVFSGRSLKKWISTSPHTRWSQGAPRLRTGGVSAVAPGKWPVAARGDADKASRAAISLLFAPADLPPFSSPKTNLALAEAR